MEKGTLLLGASGLTIRDTPSRGMNRPANKTQLTPVQKSISLASQSKSGSQNVGNEGGTPDKGKSVVASGSLEKHECLTLTDKISEPLNVEVLSFDCNVNPLHKY